MSIDELEDVWPLLARRRIFQFANATQSSSEALIARLLKKMEREKPKDAVSIFLRSAVDERALRQSWKAAVTTLKAIGAYYTWGSKPKRDRLRQPRSSRASSPRFRLRPSAERTCPSTISPCS